MVAKFFVKMLTEEGRLVDMPEQGPHWSPFTPFPLGYDTEAEAEQAIADVMPDLDSWVHSQLVILKVFTKG